MSNKRIVTDFIWKYMERCAYQGVLGIINIVLARMLAPEHFGELAIITVFVNLAQAFVQQGLSTALIQAREIHKEDITNIVLANIATATVLYAIIFYTAPLIADLYNMEQFGDHLRLMALILFPGCLNSVQNALIVRSGKYKSLFCVSFISAFFSGVVGVMAALNGLEVQALILQQLSLQIVLCILMMPVVRIKICRPQFTNVRFVQMYKFGFRLMLSSFLNTLYGDIQTLVIGKLYTQKSLGYYNQGRNYPYLIIANINTSLNTVLLPAFSKAKSREDIKCLMKNAMSVSTFVIFPLLFGLCGISKNLVDVLLTSKWNSCVPYLVLFCFIYAFYPLSTINLQAYNAVGRSGLYLKNEIAKKIVGIIFLVIFIVLWDSPIAVVISLLVASPVNVLIDSYCAKSNFNYSIWEQFKDYLPNLINASFMLAIVLVVGLLPFSTFVVLVLQIISGSITYLLAAKIYKLRGYTMVVKFVGEYLKSYRNRNK